MALVAGVDFGTRRIGLALGDDELRIASPMETILSPGGPSAAAKAVLAWAATREARRLVVGLPLNMDGSLGPQAALTRAFIEKLRDAGGSVVEWDERLSSYQADQLLAQAGPGASRRRHPRDALAAAVILQAYFDALPRPG